MSMARDKNVIWVDEVHPLSGRAAVIVDDAQSCWLYLHERANGQVLRSVLCYSPIPPVTRAEFDSCVGRGDTPILISDYASADAVIVERYPDDFAFRWRPDGEAVAVLFRDRVLAVATPEERHGSSAAIARSGPFGSPLVIERYAWL
jgi:hypothetical protein